MKKILFPIIGLLIAASLQAQVKFSLSLLSDQETYLVSVLPDKDIPAPMNIASNVQVVLKIPLGEPFLAGEITSQIPNIDWTDNAYAHQANQGEAYTLCAFTMVQSMTKAITFEEGVETPLFTFKNLESGCVGALTLPENQDVEVTKARQSRFNFTQNITLLATRGNGYSGVVNKVADCNQLSTSIGNIVLTEDLKAYPVPTQEYLNIEWNNPISFEGLQLELIGANGQLLQTLDLDPSQGAKKVQLDVRAYPSGLYNFFIKNTQNEYQQYKFIMLGK